MSKPGATGITRIIKATRYSWLGFKAAFKYEAAFRQELMFCIVMLPLALILAKNGVELVLLIGSLFLVLIVELLNSAIETVVDRFGGELHELSGRAKDIASAAVFLSLANVVIIWGIILVPQFLK